MTIRRLIFIISLIVFLFSSTVLCQLSISKNHPELKWQIFQTKHFRIIYHQGIEKIAQQVAHLAEQVYLPITSDLGFEPLSKTDIVVTDYRDYSNGLATPLGHYIFLWTQSLTKYTTGNTEWLQSLVAHEFTHIVSFWALREFPGFWRELFALGFIPTWFLEGLAEYEAEPWCAHRDMLLRVVACSHQLLPYKKMTGFIGADAIEARLVYEQGHSLIHYLTARFGRDKIALIIKNLRRQPFSFNLALKKSIGLSEKQLFYQWRSEVQKHYQQISKIRSPISITNERIVTPLQANFDARWSADGKKIAIVGLKEYEEQVSELYVLDAESLKFEKIAGPYVNSFFSWSPSGTQLIYSQTHVTRDGSDINDLFLWNSTNEKIIRLTTNERATDPHLAGDGRSLVYAVHQGAQSNLVILDLKTNQKRKLTDFPAWTEVFTPAWSPDGEQIAFSIFDQAGRDICLIEKDGTGFSRLTNNPEDDRYPAWSPDGKQIAFISYRNGTANLYILNLVSGEVFQMTDSPGGVFNPCWLPDGKHIAVIAFEQKQKTEIILVPAKYPEQLAIADTKISGLPFHSAPQPVIYSASPLSDKQTKFYSSPYRSFFNIRPQLLLPYADKNERGWQFGAANLCADPVAKHSLLTIATYGKRLHCYVDYINRQANPIIELTFNKTTINHGDFMQLTDQTILPLYENYYSGTLCFYWRANFGKSLLSNHVLWLGQTVSYRNSINRPDYKINGILDWALPFHGWINYATIGYRWQSDRPDVSYDLHPKTGFALTVYYYLTEPWLKNDLSFSQLNLSGIFRRELKFPEQVIAWRTGAVYRQGKQPLQSRLAIGTDIIRGLAYSVEGDRQIFSNLEYRFPLIGDLGFKCWIIYFERLTGALFFDAGKAWGSSLRTFYDGKKTPYTSVEWVKTVGAELRHRFYVLGKQPVVISAGYGWNIDDFSEAIFFWRIGPVF